MSRWIASIPVLKRSMLGMFLVLVYGVEARDLTRDDSLSRIKPMGLFDLNGGADFRSARVRNDIPFANEFTNLASGFSGRMQSSVRWSYRALTPGRKFEWGDILAGEVYIGKLSSVSPHQTGNLWLAYKFEFGLGGRLRINDHSEAGVNLILLKFSRDNVSGNFSGSGITGRYRYKRAMIEAGAEARQDRVLGVLIDIQKKIPLQYAFTGRYLLKRGRNIGLHLELLPATFAQDGMAYSKTWSLSLFYGIYF
jgi:hypothetical protein